VKKIAYRTNLHIILNNCCQVFCFDTTWGFVAQKTSGPSRRQPLRLMVNPLPDWASVTVCSTVNEVVFSRLEIRKTIRPASAKKTLTTASEKPLFIVASQQWRVLCAISRNE